MSAAHEHSDAQRRGRDIVAALVRFGETKAALKAALDALHTAMAITPLDLGHVTVMGDLARGVAAQLAEHEDEIQGFAQLVRFESDTEGADG